VLVYLRHGDDRGNDVYRHDRSLNDRGKKKAGKAFGDLAEKYGHPDTVFVSPFRRAIQTLDSMAASFERAVEIHRDPRIAQYLGEKRDPSISPETAALVIVVETKDAFRTRVREHAQDMQLRSTAGTAIWCITHQIVIEEVAHYFDVKIRGNLDFLDHVGMLG
jgi:broad specificity phosphatase PhoE